MLYSLPPSSMCSRSRSFFHKKMRHFCILFYQWLSRDVCVRVVDARIYFFYYYILETMVSTQRIFKQLLLPPHLLFSLIQIIETYILCCRFFFILFKDMAQCLRSKNTIVVARRIKIFNIKRLGHCYIVMVVAADPCHCITLPWRDPPKRWMMEDTIKY